MNTLKVSLTCMLMMTFDLLSAQLLKPRRCRTCAPGDFVTKNCSVTDGKLWGVQCARCTDCSATNRETLVQCSTFADSVCGNKTTPAVTWTPTDAPVSAPEVWIILNVIVFCSFVILLLCFILTLLSCRKHKQRNKLHGLDQL